jgi:hypothetical protein
VKAAGFHAWKKFRRTILLSRGFALEKPVSIGSLRPLEELEARIAQVHCKREGPLVAL